MLVWAVVRTDRTGHLEERCLELRAQEEREQREREETKRRQKAAA
ncbi:hypothetical protein [Streptomyces agglomeratus]|nr:hypothetical protein [Streptomyces agglomeratus]